MFINNEVQEKPGPLIKLVKCILTYEEDKIYKDGESAPGEQIVPEEEFEDFSADSSDESSEMEGEFYDDYGESEDLDDDEYDVNDSQNLFVEEISDFESEEDVDLVEKKYDQSFSGNILS